MKLEKSDNPKKNLLLETEYLCDVAVERITDKINNKVENYINCPIWLIGCASTSYNIGMISSIFDDNFDKETIKYINSKIPFNKKVSKIFVAEFRSKSYLLEIK